MGVFLKIPNCSFYRISRCSRSSSVPGIPPHARISSLAGQQAAGKLASWPFLFFFQTSVDNFFMEDFEN
jgi:hypothetical protein